MSSVKFPFGYSLRQGKSSAVSVTLLWLFSREMNSYLISLLISLFNTNHKLHYKHQQVNRCSVQWICIDVHTEPHWWFSGPIFPLNVALCPGGYQAGNQICFVNIVCICSMHLFILIRLEQFYSELFMNVINSSLSITPSEAALMHDLAQTFPDGAHCYGNTIYFRVIDHYNKYVIQLSIHN